MANGTECAAGCGKPADESITGIDGLAYCSIDCAWAEHDWPACLGCESEPQDPVHAPFCGEVCESAFQARVAVVRHRCRQTHAEAR